MKQLTRCFRTLKTNWVFNQSSPTIKKYSDTALWSHGRVLDTAALEGHRALRVFLTTIGRVYRRKCYSPIVHFNSDGVYRYVCKRGAVNSTAHEKTHTGRRHFSVFQNLNQENPSPCVQIGVNYHSWCARNHWPREWIYCQAQGDDAFLDFLNYHCTIHQQAFSAKMLNMKEIMDVAMKIACSI